jgi:16S rRNA (adenine1518-N6/adenine1519-N6)-dimethyltransferase
MSDPKLPPLDVPALLRKYDLRPHKGLGQNFLIDEHALQEIVNCAGLDSSEDVLEVGAGLGSLTRVLALAARHVTAVELDYNLVVVLRDTLTALSNVRIVQGDILKLNPASLMDSKGYVVVANIPYYITSAVIRHLLESELRPRRVVLTIQKEVAERIRAEDGKMSLLALSVHVYGTPSITSQIPAGAFYPPPNVDSAVLRIDLHPQPLIPVPLLDKFFSLIKAGFSQKRKNLRNSISAGMRMSPEETEVFLKESGIDPRRRAETLSLEEWGKLTENLKK